MRKIVFVLLALICGITFANAMRPICGVVQNFLIVVFVSLFALAIILFALSRFWKSKSGLLKILAIAAFIIAVAGALIYLLIPWLVSALVGVPLNEGPCAGY